MKKNFVKGMAAVLAAAALTAVLQAVAEIRKTMARQENADASSVKSDLLRLIPVPALLTV